MHHVILYCRTWWPVWEEGPPLSMNSSTPSGVMHNYLVVPVFFFSIETYLLQHEIRMTKLLCWQSGLNCVVSCYLSCFLFLSHPHQRSHASLSCSFRKPCHYYQKLAIIFWLLQIVACAFDDFTVSLVSRHNLIIIFYFLVEMVVGRV